jgi:F0F1-type ATP synthase assembly protein I
MNGLGLNDQEDASPAPEQDPWSGEPRPEEPIISVANYQPESQAESARKMGLGYAAGITFFATIAFMLFIGWGADLVLGSKPWGLVGGIVLGAVIAFIQFFRITNRIYDTPKDTPSVKPLMSDQDDDPRL